MKIAYIIPSLDNKGPIIVVNNIIRSLKNKVDVIDVYYFDVIEDSILDFDCPTYKVQMNQKIDFDAYDIIHSHCLRPDLYVNKWRKHIKRAKVITTLHQDTYKSLTYQYNKLVSFIVTRYWLYVQSKFDGVTVISKQLKDQYNHLLKNKSSVIYNGCFVLDKENAVLDIELVFSIRNIKDRGYKVIISYAYVTKRKGLAQVIKALVVLSDYAFIIIGDGPEIINLKKLVLSLNLEDRVLFFSARKTPYLYLEEVDIYAMPSYSEGFGLAMVEAALQKKSIVCSDIPAFNEIFTKDEAIFFQLDNQASLIHAIESAYQDKMQKSENAYLKVTSCFTADIMADNFLNYYKSF